MQLLRKQQIILGDYFFAAQGRNGKNHPCLSANVQELWRRTYLQMSKRGRCKGFVGGNLTVWSNGKGFSGVRRRPSIRPL